MALNEDHLDGDAMLQQQQQQLLDDQLALEGVMLDEGKDRYLRQQQRREDDQGYGSRDDISKIIKGCLPLLSQAIADWMAQASNGRGKGKTATGLKYLEEFDTDLLATLTLQATFTAMRKIPTLSRALGLIGRYVEDELWAKALVEHDPKLFDRLVGRAKRTHGSVAYRKKAVRATAAKEGMTAIERWTDDTRIKVAEPLLNALLQTLPEVFKITTTREKFNKVKKWLELTDEARAYLAEITEAEAWMYPVFKPMIAPPRPWTDLNSGGYYTPKLAVAASLIKSNDGEKLRKVRKAIRDGTMQPALDAINLIQSTAWQINQPILDLVKWAWDEGLTISKFPSSRYIEREPRPENWDDLDDKEKKGWRVRAGKVAERNRSIDGERVTVIQDFATADLLKDHDQFYIPHSLDFRGRCYPVPHFNQQRSDYIRSMLQFAEAKPLGAGGAYWLAIHVANCGDFDKISKAPFDDRAKWVEDNVDMIMEIARDPRANLGLWIDADKPFCFVAACIDFAGYLEEGDGYCSRLPVSMDGSNSGLQHYSAALRSEEGSLVNLVPQDRPADIYQAVADLVVESVRTDVEKGDPLAIKVWDQGIGRSLVKRNVMTFAYSSAQFGFKQQLMTDLMGPLNLRVLEGSLESNPYDTNGDGGFAAAGYLAGHTWRAVNALVTQAAEGMRFFQRCASALAHESKAVTWFTPVGLPVTHRYEEFEAKTVKLFLYDKNIPVVDAAKEDKVIENGVLKQVRLNVKVKPTKRIDKGKARNAIAPNVIHSMDASHLMLSVLDAYDNGIRSFSLIHDSFGTHAADTESFFHIIRRSFVDMYENYCPFEEIRQATWAALDDKTRCPDLPVKGSLDLRGVLTSDYAFA